MQSDCELVRAVRAGDPRTAKLVETKFPAIDPLASLPKDLQEVLQAARLNRSALFFAMDDKIWYLWRMASRLSRGPHR